MIIETHCHTKYSHDSSLLISDIVEQCVSKGIEGLIICDHDICGITEEEEVMFADERITLLRAIEFTTTEGVHVIGCSERIKSIEAQALTYSVLELVDLLCNIDAIIILPHPFHATGILGNNSISKEIQEKVLSKADFIEQDNYRYGFSKGIGEIIRCHDNLRCLFGSDAHSKSDVGAFCNIVSLRNLSYQGLKVSDCRIENKRNKERSWVYWKWRQYKRSSIYQFVLTRFSPELRQKIKNRLMNK